MEHFCIQIWNQHKKQGIPSPAELQMAYTNTIHSVNISSV
jgi:hypothetical protein